MDRKLVDMEDYRGSIRRSRFPKSTTGGFGGGGGGSGGDGMDYRVTVLETTLGHINETLVEIKRDYRDIRDNVSALPGKQHDIFQQLLWGGIAAIVVVFGALISGYLLLQGRSDRISDKISDLQISIEKYLSAHSQESASQPAQQSPPVPTHDSTHRRP